MILLVICLTFLLTSFIAYIIHWLFHQKWMGRFHKSHMNHHTIQYPANNFYSDKYRSPGKDDTAVLFVLFFSPIIASIILLTALNVISILFCFIMIVEMILIGLLNDKLHDHFHLNKTFLNKFSYFQKLRKLHYNHHLDMSKNFSIYWFFFDKLFGSFMK